MDLQINEATRTLLDGRNFATIATLNPDGSPHSSVVWVLRDGDALLFSTTADKQKARNLARDPRISIAIFANENPYSSAEIRGVAELIEDPGKTLPKKLSQKYLGVDPPPEPTELQRIIIRVKPVKINGFSA